MLLPKQLVRGLPKVGDLVLNRLQSKKENFSLYAQGLGLDLWDMQLLGAKRRRRYHNSVPVSSAMPNFEAHLHLVVSVLTNYAWRPS